MGVPFAALLVATALAAHGRLHVDLEAMNEAIAASDADVGYASAAAYSHFLSAQIARQAGDHPKAIAELRLALASDDGQPYLLTALAQEYARTGELGRARRLLGSLLRGHPRYVPARLLMGRVLYEQHQPKSARGHLVKAMALAPKQSDAYLLLARIAVEGKQPEKAVRIVEALWDRARDPSGFLELGGMLAERGDLTRAARLFRRVTTVDPDNSNAWTALAQTEEALGKDAQAEADFGRALEHDPDDRDALLSGGRAALRLGAKENARAYLDRLLSLESDPDTVLKVAFSYLAAHQTSDALRVLDEGLAAGDEPRLAFYAGLLRERDGDFEGALAAFTRVGDDEELGKDALLHQARCLSRLGRLDEAQGLLSSGSARHPDDPELLAALAGTVELAGHPEQAEQLLRDGLSRHPTATLYGALAELLERHGGEAEAVEVLTAALARHPDDADLAFALGSAFARQGAHARAMSQMRRVLAIDPKNAEAMNFIGFTLAERGEKLPEAERLLTKARALQPDSGAILDSLGWLYFRKGELPLAVGTLEKAVALSPDEPVILEHLGDAYARLQQPGLASAAYRRALEALRGDAGDPSFRGLGETLTRKLKMLSTEAARR